MKLVIFSMIVAIILSCSSYRAEQNEQNIKKIKIGMTIKEVKGIMSDPEEAIIYPHNENEYAFDIYLLLVLLEIMNFFLRKDSTVIRMYFGD